MANNKKTPITFRLPAKLLKRARKLVASGAQYHNLTHLVAVALEAQLEKETVNEKDA